MAEWVGMPDWGLAAPAGPLPVPSCPVLSPATVPALVVVGWLEWLVAAALLLCMAAEIPGVVAVRE